MIRYRSLLISLQIGQSALFRQVLFVDLLFRPLLLLELLSHLQPVR